MPQPPLQVQLASARSATEDARVLARVSYGHDTGIDPDDPRHVRVGLPPLRDGMDSELWWTDQPVTRGWRDGIGYARTEQLLFAQLFVPDSGDMQSAAAAAYARLLDTHRTMGYPGLLRIWNFFDRLLEPASDPNLDRYQAFCAGRHQTLEAMDIEASTLPAATAVGTESPGFLVYLLAGREPGIQIENPRQVSAYRYPPDYGPRSPSFSRATLKPWASGPQLYISGTASIVGHASLHAGDVGTQLDEILNNLQALIDSARERHGIAALRSPADLSLLKVYVKHAGDVALISERLRARIGAHPSVLFLHGDICRRELLVEIEGLHA